jgi:lysyl-tRNA synthetase class II
LPHFQRLTIFALLNKFTITMQLSEQEIIRREKLSKLQELGVNPYPANLFPVNYTSKQVKK